MLGDTVPANKYKATYLKLVSNWDTTNGHFGLWGENGGTITAVGGDAVSGSTVGGLTQGNEFYIRIVRSGNEINLFGSTDGSSWTQVGGNHILNDNDNSYLLYISTANYSGSSAFSATYSEYTEIHTI